MNNYCDDCKERKKLIESSEASNLKNLEKTISDAFVCIRELEDSLKKEYRFKIDDNVRHLQEIMINGNTIDKKIDANILITNEFNK